MFIGSESPAAALAGATLVLLSVALFAGWVPAHRASRMHSLVALRQD
ncbi:MAG: hypothetical protein WDO73_37295 [Ignavibacteriota bacterium]